MANVYPALCKTTTGTSGTSNYVVGTGANAGPYRTLKQAVADGHLSDGNTVHYMCWDTETTGDASFERGLGVYTDATNVVSRATILESSNSDAKVSWPGSGERDFYILNIAPDLATINIEADVSIGDVSTPDGTLHVHSSTAGSVTAAGGAAPDLVVESGTSGGISIFVPNSSTSSLVFGNPADSQSAIAQYKGSTDEMIVGTAKTGASVVVKTDNFTTALTINSDGSVTFAPLSSAPSSPTKGQSYMDGTTNKFRTYDGTVWQDHW